MAEWMKAPLGEPEHYSLWAMPDTVLTRKAKSAVIALAHTRSTPVFDPHLTLVSHWSQNKEEFVGSAVAFAAKWKSSGRKGIGVTFEPNVARGSSRYQCVFLKGIGASDEFEEARILCSECFDAVPPSHPPNGLEEHSKCKPSKFTHMSLLYDAPVDGTDWDRCVSMATDALCSEGLEMDSAPITTRCEELWVVHIIPGHVERWEVVSVMSL